MKAKEHFYSYEEISSVVEQISLQNVNTKDTSWLRAQFLKYVEGYQSKKLD